MISPSNFSWIDYDVCASAFPWDKTNFEYLIQQHNVSVIINLSEKEYVNPFPNKLEVHFKPIPDFGIPSINLVKEIIKIIDQSRNQGKRVLIHCIAGCGRTGLIIGLWKASQDQQFSREGLLDQLRKLRPCSIESDVQEEFFKSFEFN